MPSKPARSRPAALNQIWAPWRMEYIQQPREKGCFLCKSFRSRADRDHGVVFRGRSCAVILNRYPYTGGHLMVAPLRHTESLQTMTGAEWSELMWLTRRAVGWLDKALHPHGFNVGFNLGEAAGAGLKDHAHLHIVPRWNGDTNFMPVLGRSRVIPQALDATYELLSGQLAAKRRNKPKL